MGYRFLSSVEEVIDLANKGKSVYVLSVGKNIINKLPAAFVQNWPARLLVNRIRARHLSVEDKP